MITSQPPDSAASFDVVADQLANAFDRWSSESGEWSDELLDAWAERAFALQYAGNDPYRRYCDARGVSPGVVGSWRDVPACYGRRTTLFNRFTRWRTAGVWQRIFDAL